jgi:3-hydroxy-9,10-secoandrosta-1,3,5(10)-triene-9,17-dione monooxygenase reductase component
MNAIDPKQFRNALGAFTTGVTVVTTHHAGLDIGLTANSFNSVSLDPPMVLWSLAKTSGSLGAFNQNDCFAVHILSNRQEALSGRFAKRGIDKFEGLELTRGHGGVPLLAGCSARFECRTAYRYEGGDHVIFVGEVVKFEHFGLPPLVFQSGSYALAVKKPAEYAAEEAAYQIDGFGRNALTYLLGRVFHQLRYRFAPQLEAHGLNDVENQVISVLGISDERQVGELDALVRLTGQSVTVAALDGLVQRGYVTLRGEGAAALASLTAAGRQLNIELVAATKALEDDALEGFDHGEVQVLTHLVQRLARATRADTPPLWKKDS